MDLENDYVLEPHPPKDYSGMRRKRVADRLKDINYTLRFKLEALSIRVEEGARKNRLDLARIENSLEGIRSHLSTLIGIALLATIGAFVKWFFQ